MSSFDKQELFSGNIMTRCVGILAPVWRGTQTAYIIRATVTRRVVECIHKNIYVILILCPGQTCYGGGA